MYVGISWFVEDGVGFLVGLRSRNWDGRVRFSFFFVGCLWKEGFLRSRRVIVLALFFSCLGVSWIEVVFVRDVN